MRARERVDNRSIERCIDRFRIHYIPMHASHSCGFDHSIIARLYPLDWAFAIAMCQDGLIATGAICPSAFSLAPDRRPISDFAYSRTGRATGQARSIPPLQWLQIQMHGAVGILAAYKRACGSIGAFSALHHALRFGAFRAKGQRSFFLKFPNL